MSDPTAPDEPTTPEPTTPEPVAPELGQYPIAPVGDDYPVDENDEAPPRPKPRRTAKGAAIVGIRVVAGTVGLAVAAATIAVAAIVPLPTIARTPHPLTVTPVPTAQQLVCPGSLLRLGDETGQGASTASAFGQASLRYDASGGEVTAAPLAEAGAPGSPILISSPVGTSADDRILVAGAQAEVAATGEFSGLAATDCVGVATETWLVGGSTSVGRTTLVTLSNPSDTVSTVALEIAGETGAITAPGATGIVVQPHTQRVLSLAGFAPDVESPVVHVESRGGQIVASLQQATVRGLEPGGVDIVGATTSPSTSQVVPGVVVSGADALATRIGEEGFSDLATVVRVFVPGDKPTTAQVSVVADDGSATGASFSVELEPGMVDDLPIDGLVDGNYTVSVTTAVPVVAGVRVSTVATSVDPLVPGASDFAWLAASSQLDGDSLVAVAAGPSPRIHLFNPTADDADVTLTTGGVDTVVTVAAESSASMAAEPGSTYEVSDFDALVGAVSYSGPGAIAGYPVQPPARGSGPIRVLP
jgi:hypothetical protein